MITESQPDRSFEQRIPRKLFLLGFLAILVSLTIDELHAQSIPEAERAASYSGLQDMVIIIVKTFDMKFTLYDGENLLFRLESFKELTP